MNKITRYASWIGAAALGYVLYKKWRAVATPPATVSGDSQVAEVLVMTPQLEDQIKNIAREAAQDVVQTAMRQLEATNRIALSQAIAESTQQVSAEEISPPPSPEPDSYSPGPSFAQSASGEVGHRSF